MTAGATPEVGSAAFLEDLARRLAAAPAAGGRRVALGQLVTGPSGERSWTVHAGGDEVATLVEGIAGAEVCLVADEDAARQLLAGAPPAALLAEGRIKVRGDATALVEGQEALASVGAALRSPEEAPGA